MELTQKLEVLLDCWGVLDLETVPLSQHFQGLAFLTLFITKQLKEILFVKVLLEDFLGRVSLQSLKVHTSFEHLTSVNLLLETSHCHESVHDCVFLLAYSVTAVNCLVVISRVPVGVKDHCPVSACESEAKPTYLCSKQAAKQ